MRNKLFEAIKPLQLNTNDKNKLVNTIIDIGNSGGGGGEAEYEYYLLKVDNSDKGEMWNQVRGILLYFGVIYGLAPSYKYPDGKKIYKEMLFLDFMNGLGTNWPNGVCIKALKLENIIMYGMNSDYDYEFRYTEETIINGNLIEKIIQILELPIESKSIINNMFYEITKEQYDSLIGQSRN